MMQRFGHTQFIRLWCALDIDCSRVEEDFDTVVLQTPAGGDQGHDCPGCAERNDTEKDIVVEAYTVVGHAVRTLSTL